MFLCSFGFAIRNVIIADLKSAVIKYGITNPEQSVDIGYISLYKIQKYSIWNGQATAGVPDADAVVAQMVSDSQSHTNFTPLPGGWAAVIFVPQGTDPNSNDPQLQTMFVQVDP